MQRAHGVGHRRERIAHVVLQVAGQTRLFHDEHTIRRERRMDAFQHLPWPHATINGWYYTAAPKFSLNELGEIARAAIASRGRIFGFVLDVPIRVGTNPEVADRRVLRRLAEEWRTGLLPRYQTLVAA